MQKILFFLEDNNRRAGTERIVTAIANGLSDRYEVTMLTAWNEGRTSAFPLADAVFVHDLGMVKKDYFIRLLRKKALKKKLELFLEQHPQDVIFVTGGQSLHIIPQLKDGSKKVFWYQFCFNKELLQLQNPCFSWKQRCIYRRKFRRKLSGAKLYDRVVVLTQHDSLLWQREFPNTSFIYNEVTLPPAGKPDYMAKQVLAVGRLTYQKGFDHLVKAWEQVNERHPDWHLNIYGEGELRQQLQKQIDLAGLSQRVHLKGNIKDMASVYAQHSIFVLSSNYEGFGLVLVEAANAGLPLVSYDCECGPSEIVHDGQNGFLVSPVGNVDGLASALSRLMDSESLRRTMGQAARQSLTPFSHERVMAHWDAFLQEMARSASDK